MPKMDKAFNGMTASALREDSSLIQTVLFMYYKYDALGSFNNTGDVGSVCNSL